MCLLQVYIVRQDSGVLRPRAGLRLHSSTHNNTTLKIPEGRTLYLQAASEVTSYIPLSLPLSPYPPSPSPSSSFSVITLTSGVKLPRKSQPHSLTNVTVHDALSPVTALLGGASRRQGGEEALRSTAMTSSSRLSVRQLTSP
ncbi:hypothetical protein E2C01_089666 [Portunus trituberculatus]|uniref:Uncharacterized protein n=1 Tax=Portunus trituberculatus TaxID=210409 RepID=A0A5B7JIV4_PORTR|nr:hypothetical protein [Portunus trituberculatus]